MKNGNLGRYLQFALVILAAGSIYPLIYLKAQYQETILEVFNMSLTQMNTIYTVLGLVFIVGYFPSGVLSDKFSAKNLLALSLLGTALGGFWFAQVPTYEYVVVIFAIWGFFSVFTFWSSHMKVVKMLSSDDEDGRFFGILDGGRGLVEALLASLALAIFTVVLGSSIEVTDKRAALVSIVYMYSTVLLVTSILVFFFVKDGSKTAKKVEKEPGSEESGVKFSDLGKVFTNKYIYLHGIIIFAGYTVFWTSYYFGGHLQSNLGMTPIGVGSIMVAVLWMRPFGGIIGGFLADKIGKEVTITCSLLGGSACLILMVFLPKTLPSMAISGLVILAGLFVYMIRGTYWSLLGQSKIDIAIMGTAIGAVSFIGYLPDIMIPLMNSYLWDVFGNEGGYQAYFLVSAVVGLFGAVIAMIYRRSQIADKKNEQALQKTGA
ncbi:nitrate/nitrite transporter [Serratia sp. DD3]|uniref:MFS transporter n=1 Tax=Serratia sp. DD3 TaxID=1410619 RepID=UPI0003C51C53|nr:MFS transporter [Serratia sp. DD3]KEY57300.1 inner membrane protein YihN [Serratia sp. DD3]